MTIGVDYKSSAVVTTKCDLLVVVLDLYGIRVVDATIEERSCCTSFLVAMWVK